MKKIFNLRNSQLSFASDNLRSTIDSSLRKKFKSKIKVVYDFGHCDFKGKIWQNGDLEGSYSF